MSDEKVFLEKIEKIIESSQEAVEVVGILVEMDLPKADSFTINAQVLANYMYGLKFDWDNLDAIDDGKEEKLASETVGKIKQILADIKSGNQYTKIFSVELAYSRLKGDDYTYKIMTQKMSATTHSEATKEKDEIRAQAPKQHPTDKEFALEDVRLRVKVVDQKGDTILKEDFLLN